MRSITKRSTGIVTAALVAAGGGGAAWAAWFNKGAPTAFGSAGSLKPLYVSGAKVVGDPLVSGRKAGIEFKVRNDNKYPVSARTLAVGDFASETGTCDAPATFSQVPNALVPAAITTTKIDPGKEVTFVWPDAVQLTSNPDDDCQGQKFSFALTVGAASAAGVTG